MTEIVFGRWGNVVRDLRETGEKVTVDDEGFPSTQGFPEDLAALMCGKGVLIFRKDLDYFSMARRYLEEIQAKYCCGRCMPGIRGTKILQLVLDRIARGEGRESDLELLADVAETLDLTARCSVCQSAGELIKDGLTHFRQSFDAALASGDPNPDLRYLGKISAPCMNACPSHINIPAYVEALQDTRYEECLEIIREEMPLPGVTGRVCPAPCQKACTLANAGKQPIPIRLLKRVAADYEMDHKVAPPLHPREMTEKPVAVVGAGPAGLTVAHYLALLGHPVTVFEALHVSGGMVGVGIPPYRHPRAVLKREIDIIRGLGVEVKEGASLGQDFTLDELFSQGFQAVFLGVGSHKSMGLGLDDKGIEGVFRGGIDFLRDLNLGMEVKVGERAIVVGGGNTAVDCARTCLRMGASEVQVVYRRTEKEMPADPIEVEDAEEEGVIFNYLTQPIELIADEGRLTGLKCIRMRLGEPDGSGRRRPVPVEGSDFVIAADTLIPAIGQKSDLSFLGPSDRIEVTRWETIKVDPDTMMTSRPGVFAAGDAVSGPLTVVHGVAGGKLAAAMIHQYLTTGKCSVSDEKRIDDIIAVVEKDTKVRVTPKTESREAGKIPPRKLDQRERITSFDEVESGFTQEGSFVEASRCLRCYHLVFGALSQ
ncbi:MAG: FAD-dependent oxidoreductase [Thermodesulfobacteriota bacterium]